VLGWEQDDESMQRRHAYSFIFRRYYRDVVDENDEEGNQPMIELQVMDV